MGTIKTTASEVYRDYDVDGVPATPAHDPEKRDIRGLFGIVDSAVYAAQAGMTTVADTAARDAYYATAENQGNLVYVNDNNGEPDDPANGVYEYVDGAPRIAEGFYQGVAVVVQPLVDDAVDASEIAVESSLASLRSMGDAGGDVVDTFGSAALNSSITGAGAWSTGIPIARDGVVDEVSVRVSADMVGDILLADGPTGLILAKAAGVNFTSGVDVTAYPFGVSVAPAGALVWIERTSGGFIRTGASGDCITVAAGSYAVGATLPAYTIVAVAAVSIEVSVQTSLSPVAQRVAKYDRGRIDQLVTLPRGETVRSHSSTFMSSSLGAAGGNFYAKRHYGEGVLTSVDIPMLGSSTGYVELWRIVGGVSEKLDQISVQLVSGANNIPIPRWMLRGISDIRYAPVTGANVTYGDGGLNFAYPPTQYAIGATATVTVGAGLSIRIGLNVEAAAGASPASMSAKRATLDRQMFAGSTVPGDWAAAAPFSVNNGLLASGTGGWDKFAGFASGSSLHKRRLSARVQINDTASIFGIASKPVGEVIIGGAVALIDGPGGELAIYSHNGTAAAGTRIAGTSFASALVTGRFYTQVVTIDGLDVEVVLTDCVTGSATAVSFTMAPTFGPDTNPTARFHGRPGFVHRAGDWRADWTHFELDAPRGQPFAIFGDSNLEVGGGATAVGPTWGHQLVTANGGGIISAMSGEESGYMARTLTDLVDLRVPLAICAHGTNDETLAEWRASVGDFVDACCGMNVEPVLCHPLPQPGKQALMTSMSADITDRYFGKLRSIDFLGALSNGGNRTSWNAAFDNGDGIHANAAGQAEMKAQAERDIPELKP